MNRRTSDNRVWRVAALLSLALFFAGFDRDAWGSDESRVAGIVLEMADDGQFAVPHLGGAPFVEKPPLYFMVAAGSVHLLSEWIGIVPAIRLSSVMWGLGTVWCAYLLARLLTRTARAESGAGAVMSPEVAERAGLLAVAFLSTSVAFLANALQIRTDIALTCLTTAAVWAFAEFYLAQRVRMLPFAGLLLAGAFLTKGPIALVFVGAAWLGLFPRWVWQRTRPGNTQPLFIGAHLLCLALFVLGVGTWVYLLRVEGGQELFDEWFWRNQVARVTGSAGLGHVRSATPFFYAQPLLVHGLPWSPVALAFLVSAVGRLWSRRGLDSPALMLLACMGISLVVLSITSTKRAVYILPLVPLMSVAAACRAAREGLPRWFRGFMRAWMGLALFALGVVTLLPALQGWLPAAALAELGTGPIPWTAWHAVSALGFVSAAWVAFGRRIPGIALRCVTVTAVTIVCVSMITTPLLDGQESRQARVRNFAEKLSGAPRDQIAGYAFPERLRGQFYLYLRWAVPQVDTARLAVILAGDDPDYTSVLIHQRGDLPATTVEPTLLATEDTEDLEGEGTLSWVTAARR